MTISYGHDLVGSMVKLCTFYSLKFGVVEDEDKKYDHFLFLRLSTSEK